MGNMTTPHYKISITNNLIIWSGWVSKGTCTFMTPKISKVFLYCKKLLLTVLSVDFEDRWIEVCSLISLLSPTSRKHSSSCCMKGTLKSLHLFQNKPDMNNIIFLPLTWTQTLKMIHTQVNTDTQHNQLIMSCK